MSIYDPITSEPSLEPPEPKCEFCNSDAIAYCSNCDSRICRNHKECVDLCPICANNEEE